MAAAERVFARHAVIGGGVVGLAVAARLARIGSTIVLERNGRLGEETSSRNSEARALFSSFSSWLACMRMLSLSSQIPENPDRGRSYTQVCIIRTTP